jgi:phosphoglycolate phosphatase
VTSLFVFDLDGTLVDSRRDIAESANAVLEECGCRPHSEETIGSMVGDGAAVLIARAFAAAGALAPPDALDRFLRVYNTRLLRFTRAYDGIPELLESLSSRAVLAVLTNKPLAATRTILDGLRLARFFATRVIGGDGPLPRKPDPAGLQSVIAQASVSANDTLMVGDSVIDLRTAHAAAVRACLARYGFGHTPAATEILDRDDIVIDHPLDLLSSL